MTQGTDGMITDSRNVPDYQKDPNSSIPFPAMTHIVHLHMHGWSGPPDVLCTNKTTKPQRN